MSNKQKEFIFIPDRDKNMPEIRYAKRRTTVRPIKFCKTWDTTFSPRGSEPLVPNSPKFFSQPNPVENGKHPEQTRDNQEAESNDKESEVYSDSANDQVATSGHEGGGEETSDDKNDSMSTRNKQDRSRKTDNDKNDNSVSENSANDQVVTSGHEGGGEETPDATNDSMSTRNKQDRSKKTDHKKNDKTVSENSSSKNVQNEEETSLQNHNPIKSQNKSQNKSDARHFTRSEQNQNKSQVASEDHDSSDSNGIHDKGDSARINETGKNQSKNISTVVKDKSKVYNTRQHDSLIRANQTGTDNSAKNNPEKQVNKNDKNSSIPVETEKDNMQRASFDDGESQERNEQNSEIEESIDITHKIPVAHSTAIGIEIEQEEDEEEDEDEEENADNQENNEEMDVDNESHEAEDADLPHQNSSQKKESLKRKLTSSTPRRAPSTAIKKRKITINEPISVENIGSGSITPESNQDGANQRSQNQKEDKNNSRSAVTFQPKLTDKTKPTNSEMQSKTPDLRKAMLLSYANTPSGSTMSYVAAPESGPVVRPTKQIPKKQKVPLAIEMSADSSTDTNQVQEVRLWQEDIEGSRKVTDTTDLDVILQLFEEVAWDFKEEFENGPVKKAVTLCAKNMQRDVRNLITLSHQIKQVKISCSRSQAVVRRKREELLAKLKDHTSLKVELAELKMEHDVTVSKSEKQSDILAFQKAVKTAQKEVINSKNSKKQILQVIAPTLEQHKGLSRDMLKELEQIHSKTTKILQKNCKLTKK